MQTEGVKMAIKDRKHGEWVINVENDETDNRNEWI